MSMRDFLVDMLVPGTLLVALYAALAVAVLVHGAIVEF